MIRLILWLFSNPDPNLDRRLDWEPVTVARWQP